MIPKDKKKKFEYVFLSVERLARWPKNGQRLSVSTTSFFYQSSKFHIWIASIKLSFKFEYEFCPTRVNQDGQRNGHHLLVCTYRHSTLVIYYPIAAKFHIYMSADLTKGSFEHFSSFCVIKISKTSKFLRFCMFLQQSQIASYM